MGTNYIPTTQFLLKLNPSNKPPAIPHGFTSCLQKVNRRVLSKLSTPRRQLTNRTNQKQKAVTHLSSVLMKQSRSSYELYVASPPFLHLKKKVTLLVPRTAKELPTMAHKLVIL